MTLFDYYLRYMTEVWEGTRPAPEGITLPEGGDAKVGQADGAIYVNLFETKAGPPPADAPTQVAAAPSPRFSSSAASRFLTAASDEPPSACAAFRRSAGSGEASSSLAVA